MAGDTRAVLVQAAIDVLRESGFAGASARRIAQRAGTNQALVFYHFGSVNDLLVAALEEVSARRMAAYRELLDRTGTLAELITSARSVFEADLDAGHVRVLTEMISGAQSVPGLGERVAACLAPWRDFAAAAVRDVLVASPVAALLPAEEAAHAVVAGILGLEMLASLDGDRTAALALFDRALAVGDVLDRLRPIASLLDLGGTRKAASATRSNPSATTKDSGKPRKDSGGSQKDPGGSRTGPGSRKDPRARKGPGGSTEKGER